MLLSSSAQQTNVRITSLGTGVITQPSNSLLRSNMLIGKFAHKVNKDNAQHHGVVNHAADMVRHQYVNQNQLPKFKDAKISARVRKI